MIPVNFERCYPFRVVNFRSAATRLLRWSLKLEAEAAAVEAAVGKVLSAGLRTADIAAGGPALGTRALTEAILAAIQ